ncbi:MAG: hypothetical protein CL842_13135 [Crocinitomicaceae bacterium]|nr:hypothetical protein [Crocinitomicaceae bacterium]|tara:strand:+ start:61476 stop:62609 length:1134 start_codon:yes stop_codon:yes gene_type:complete
MSKTLKILALTSWYPNSKDPQLGVFIKQQLSAIGSMHSVVLHTLEACQSFKEKEISRSNGFTHVAHYYKTSGSFMKPIEWYLAWQKILRTLKKENFDLIHTHVAFPIGIIALQAKRKLNLPLLLSEHWSGYRSTKEYKGWLRIRVTKSLVKSSTAVAVNSNYLRELMEKQHLLSKYFIVPNIVRFSEAKNDSTTLDQKKVLFMNIADHIDSDKNISGLLEAFGSAKKSNPNIRLIQIGDGPDNKILHLKAKSLGLEKEIVWKGRLANEEVLDVINSCDCGVINSNQETFSIVAFEFLAAKKPIIITECGGPIEYLPAVFGIKIPVNEPTVLTEAIVEISKTHASIPLETSATEIRAIFSQATFLSKIEKMYQYAINP